MDGEAAAAAMAQDQALMGDAAPGGMDENGLRPPVEEAKVEEVIPEEILEDMHNLWHVFDMKNTEAVPIDHLRVIMRALDFDLDQDQLEVVRKQIDPNNTGKITFANLKLVMEDKLKDSDTPEDMMAQLKHLDKDGDGMIPIPEFKQYMQNLGRKMTPEQIEDFMKEADTKGDG